MSYFGCTHFTGEEIIYWLTNKYVTGMSVDVNDKLKALSAPIWCDTCIRVMNKKDREEFDAAENYGELRKQHDWHKSMHYTWKKKYYSLLKER